MSRGRSCAPESLGVKRLECLDGLRGVLALYVLLTHMAPFAPLPHTVAWLLSHGEAGVDLFFILSGLVIVRSIEHFRYRSGPFLLARAARTLPAFLTVFVIAVAVQPLAVDFSAMPWIGAGSTARMIWTDGWPANWVIQLLIHCLMLHGLFPNGVLPDVWVSFLGAAWSLSTEWQFYALVALIGARLGEGTQGLWRLTAVLLVLGALSVAWHAHMPLPWQFSRAFLPNKAVYFALGVASAVLLREPGGWIRFVIVLAGVMGVCVMQDNRFKLLTPLVWMICLAAQMTQGQVPRAWPLLRRLGATLSSPPLQWLGLMSYCIYLVNEPLQKLLGVLLARVVEGNVALFTVIWLPMAVFIPLAVAWGLHRWVEAPALSHGRQLAAAL
jgi:peptidoglycan/LPS O-acetylase OafA/YrhL